MSSGPSTSALVGSVDRRRLAAMAFAALGVVYGDIGTSPLYALRECVSGAHGVAVSEENVYGLLSLTVWSLVMVVCFKYVTFVLRADNRGEGGILALLGLLSGPANFGTARRTTWLVALILFGTGLLAGEGIITPAISVLSAVEGLAVAAPSLHAYVVPVTVVVLTSLFAIQSRGTAKVGALFGPVMLVWFLTLAGLGIYHIADNLSVLRAINPLYGLEFLVHHGAVGFRVLGSVVLVFTGVEALYADMGHFGRSPIRWAWFVLVFPALLLNYFGQGAVLLADPSTAPNLFFSLVPKGPLTWALVILSTGATIIASQALISGMFSIINQAVQLGYFPRVTVEHTSSAQEGQIYIPEVNWGLAVACLALVVGFKSSSALAAAYGIAVTGTMCVTSLAFYQVARVRWGWTLGKALPLVALFLVVDVPYFLANLVKFFHGGYIPMAIGALSFLVMITWKRGRELLADHFRRNAWPLDRFLSVLVDQDKALRVRGGCVVMASTDQYIPLILTHHVRHTHVLHETVVLLTVTVEGTPRVPDERRVEARPLGHGLWRVIVRYGFFERPEVPAALQLARERYELPVVVDELTYFIGRETLVASNAGQMKRWQELLFSFLSRNALPATAYFKLPPHQVVELGIQLDL